MPKRQIKGKVISNSMDKTVVIGVQVTKRHKVYKKLIKRLRKFKARDELGLKVGDVALIEECPPYSKTVTWKVIENLSAESA